MYNVHKTSMYIIKRRLEHTFTNTTFVSPLRSKIYEMLKLYNMYYVNIHMKLYFLKNVTDIQT